MAVGPEHECRQGRRCKARIKNDEGAFHGTGVERPGTLCHPCEDNAFEAIWSLATDWDDLAEALTEPRVTADQGQNVTRTAERPLPLRADVDAVMTDIVSELVRWTRRVARDEELPRGDGECVKRCVVILGARKGTLIDLPPRQFEDWTRQGDALVEVTLDGVDAVLRLARLHGRALAVLGQAQTRIWLPDPCPACGRKSLSPSANQERISCQGCHVVWDAKHFALLGNVLDFERRALKVSA